MQSGGVSKKKDKLFSVPEERKLKQLKINEWTSQQASKQVKSRTSQPSSVTNLVFLPLFSKEPATKSDEMWKVVIQVAPEKDEGEIDKGQQRYLR